MQKFILFILLFSFTTGFGQKLKFTPKKDHLYAFQTEVIVFEGGLPKGALKTDVEITFFKKNTGFSIKLNQAQMKTSSFVLDTRNLAGAGKKDSAKVKDMMSEPFIFKPENGKLNLISHAGVKNFDEGHQVIEEFGKFYNPKYNEFYKGIVLKKGYSWSVTDFTLAKTLSLGNGPIPLQYTVRDISEKEAVIYGKGTMEEEQDTTSIAVKYVLDKKTGIPLYTKLVTYGDDDKSILMINRIKDYQAPGALEEFMAIETLLFVNSVRKYDELPPREYIYKKRPLTTDRDKLEELVKQCLDSLEIHDSRGKNMYQLSGYGHEILDSLLIGAYATVNQIRFYNRKGHPVELKRNINAKYNVPLHIGPYHTDLYQKPPIITKVEIDVTTFTPTQRKTISLVSDTNNSDYNFKISDSSVVINFKDYMNVDYQSFRFFDHEGNELTPKWISNYINERIFTNKEAFTQEFLEQVPGKRKEVLYSMKFLVNKVSKVTFDILTDDLKFRHKKAIYGKYHPLNQH